MDSAIILSLLWQWSDARGKVFRRTVGHKKPPLIHGWALIQCKLNCKNSFCGFFFLHTAQTWSRKKKEITTLCRGSIVMTRVKMSGGRVGDKKLPMLLHASPSSCCSSWSSSSSFCSSYANLAGTRNAKNLEQNTSQLEKNETYLVHWSALPPTCLSWNFKTKKWTHVHWIYVSCLFPQLLHTWSTRRDLWVWLQCWLLLHQRMRNGPPRWWHLG